MTTDRSLRSFVAPSLLTGIGIDIGNTVAPSPHPEIVGCFGVKSGNAKLILACFTLILYSGICAFKFLLGDK
jgi:hypothetical protein